MAQANIKAVITAEDRASQTLKQFSGSVDKMGSGLAGSFKRAEKGSKILLGTVAAFGAVALGLFAKFVLKGGFERALKIEDARAKLKGLGHDTKSIETIMDSALQSVLGTAFGLDTAATAAASAVAAGVKPGKELTRVLSLTGDAATFMGNDFERASLIINKVLTSNRLTMREVNQMHQAGIPIMQMLADEYGVTAAEMTEMVSRGEIDSEKFLKALETNIGGSAVAAGDTTRGAWDNMQAAMSRVGAQIADKILPKIKDAMQGLTKWFDNNAEKITNATLRIADGMLAVGEAVAKVFKKENEALLWAFAGAIMVGVVPALRAWAIAQWAVLKPLIPFLAVGAALGVLALVITKNWDKIAPVINAVRGAFSLFWELIKPLREFVVNQFMAAWRDLTLAFNIIKKELEPFMPQLRILAMILGGVVLAAILAGIGALVILTAIVGGVIVAVSRFIGWLARLQAWVIRVGREFRQGFAAGLNLAVSLFRSLPGRIMGVLSQLPGMGFRAGWGLLRALANGIYAAAAAPIKAAASIVQRIRDLLPGSDAKTGPLSDLMKSGVGFAERFAEGIEKGMDTAVKAGREFSGEIAMTRPGVETPVKNETSINRTTNINVNFTGVFTGNEKDMRRLAERVFRAEADVASMNGMSLSEKVARA